MSVEFKRDIHKVFATIKFIASQDIPDLTPAKLLKLIFLADKYHLVRYGRPITGDNYCAMPEGPVPSWTYDLLKQILNKPLVSQAKQLANDLVVDRKKNPPTISTRATYDARQLSESDIQALNITLKRFRNHTFGQLRKYTHAMAAYENVWNSRGQRNSVPMMFEDFFVGDGDALPDVKEELIENVYIQRSLAG